MKTLKEVVFGKITGTAHAGGEWQFDFRLVPSRYRKAAFEAVSDVISKQWRARRKPHDREESRPCVFTFQGDEWPMAVAVDTSANGQSLEIGQIRDYWLEDPCSTGA